MEDLTKMAIVLIYPDGTVEKIPIGEYGLHIEYFREQLKKSPRFYDICKGLDFYNTDMHGRIDTMLSLNGVIIIFNLDLRDIVEGYFDFQNKLPSFAIAVPENLESLEQTLILEKIYTNYPEENLVCEKFSREQDVYLGEKYFDIKDYIREAKEGFGSRSF